MSRADCRPRLRQSVRQTDGQAGRQAQKKTIWQAGSKNRTEPAEIDASAATCPTLPALPAFGSLHGISDLPCTAFICCAMLLLLLLLHTHSTAVRPYFRPAIVASAKQRYGAEQSRAAN
ncbi:hypothetical protein LZ31DRAFT_68274 [Colletotrichum somersetense]|nr:hypothetical protein LZ31DRAFT_68274 [Colletotrichum somersetense]